MIGKSKLHRAQTSKADNMYQIRPQGSERSAVVSRPCAAQQPEQLSLAEKIQNKEVTFAHIHELAKELRSELEADLILPALQKAVTVVNLSSTELTLEQFKSTFHRIVKDLNYVAVRCLGKGESSQASEILLQCEKWTQQSTQFGFYPLLRALTMNNMGTLHRRQENYKRAQGYFETALNTLLSSNERRCLGLTYLNLSMLSAQRGNHSAALQLARQALMENQYEFYEYLRQRTAAEDQYQLFQPRPSQLFQPQSSRAPGSDLEYEFKAQTLVASYHHLAREEDLAMEQGQAHMHFEASAKVAEEYLGMDSRLARQCKKDF